MNPRDRKYSIRNTIQQLHISLFLPLLQDSPDDDDDDDGEVIRDDCEGDMVEEEVGDPLHRREGAISETAEAGCNNHVGLCIPPLPSSLAPPSMLPLSRLPSTLPMPLLPPTTPPPSSIPARSAVTLSAAAPDTTRSGLLSILRAST